MTRPAFLALWVVAAAQSAIGPAVEKNAPQPSFQCPQGRTLDCMPLSEASKRGLCSAKAIAWIKAHCKTAVEIVY